MYALYQQAGFGWDEQAKRGELFDDASRFIILYPKSTKRGSKINLAKPCAYTMFQFSFETTDSDDEIPVLYW
ncbi:hypothetical protein H4R33_003399 [Dimargaris cristalligena]|nr:hypothetical protein H4R33_003399 [Dimargaris cristalligena]